MPAQIRNGIANFTPSLRMRSSCDADHTRQVKNSNAASGTMPMMTTPEGKSAIDSSNVAMNSVTPATIVAAITPDRTDGLAAVVSCPVAVNVVNAPCSGP